MSDDKPDNQKLKKDKNKSDEPDSEHFLIVGLGASAGGIQALKGFFSKVPGDSGIAWGVAGGSDGLVHATGSAANWRNAIYCLSCPSDPDVLRWCGLALQRNEFG